MIIRFNLGLPQIRDKLEYFLLENITTVFRALNSRSLVDSASNIAYEGLGTTPKKA